MEEEFRLEDFLPYHIAHPEEFEPYDFNKDERIIPKANVTKEGLQYIYRFEVESEDNFVVDNPKEICKRMVEKFKASKCYNYKSEEERQEIIKYLMAHPEDTSDFM